ncbi:MAG: fimbrillin family protein [Muribaculaceae bacterium]|nr:fimbrillin family protein [Muribaculaceae bacterium]
MKKIYSKLLIILALVSFASCGEKDTPEQPNNKPSTEGAALGITTADIQTKSAVLEYANGSTMNVFAKTYNDAAAPDIQVGVKATYDGAKWTMEPPVYLNDAQAVAFVFAVSPYDASYTDLKNIPVDLSKQVDLMYSGPSVAASKTSPNVKLKMNHALSLLSFNIVPVNYTGAGNLTSLAINGENVYRAATMDGSNGKVQLTEKGEVKNSFNRTVEKGGWKTDIPGLWTLPFNTKVGAVTLTAVIDGKTFESIIPEAEVKQGWQYIFRLALTNSGLEFDPTKTETLSLNVTTDEQQDFEGYGKIVITASGSSLTAPTVNGDAVFGTIAYPSGNSSYTDGKQVDNLNSGDQVTVEAWNSNGFVLQSLEGIGVIDISSYE